MKNLLKSFVCGEEGFLLSTEGVLIATITVIGLLAGIVAVRDAIVLELDDFAAAVGDLDQSYQYNLVADPSNSVTTEGGAFVDTSEATDAQTIEVATAGDGEDNT